MKAIVLAAGYATRLYPLTENTAKPLLEVKGKPIINHIINKLEDLPLEEIIVVTNDKFFPQFQEWQANSQFKLPVKVVSDGTKSDADRKGALADIKFVLDKEGINDDFCVVAGDNLFNFSLKKVFEAFQKHKDNVVCLYDVGFLNKARELGIAELDKNDKIVGFEEKPENPVSTLAATCIYFLPKESVHLLSDYLAQSKKKDRPGDFIQWLCQNHRVYGYVCYKKWFDIGSHESLETARKEFQEAEEETKEKKPEVEDDSFFGLKNNR